MVELSEFVKAFEEEKFDVEAAPVAAVAAAPVAGAAAAEEKNEFDVILSAVGDRRSRSSRPSALSPTWAWLKPRLSSTALRRLSWRRPRKEDAEKAKSQLEEAGATVELK